MQVRIGFHRSGLLFFKLILFLCLVGTPFFATAATQDEGIDRGMQEKLIEPAIPNKELRSAEKFWEEVDRFALIGNIQAFGTYSDIDGGGDLWGGSFYGLVAPAVKINDEMMFIFMYDGQYDRKRELYSDGYGFRKRNEFQRHAFTPMLRMDFGDDARYSITPSINYTATWNKDEGEDDSWDTGLYNYRDEGVGLDFDMRECLGEYGHLVLSLQYYKRRYPNFDSIDFSIVGGGGIEVTIPDDKDYHGFIPRIEFSWIKDAGFSWEFDYIWLKKNYDDKKVPDAGTGVLSDKDQKDHVHEFNLGLWYYFEEIAGGLNVGLDLGCRIYDSNYNNVDFIGPLVTDFEVNEDFLDYTSYTISPNVAYTFELIPLTASCSYSYEKVYYSDRWAYSAVDLPKFDDQWEVYHGIVLGLKFDMTEKLSLLAQWERIKSRSNNDNESVYEYDYRVDNLMIGAKYDF